MTEDQAQDPEKLADTVEAIRQYSIYLWRQNGIVRSRSIAKGIQDRIDEHLGAPHDQEVEP